MAQSDVTLPELTDDIQPQQTLVDRGQQPATESVQIANHSAGRFLARTGNPAALLAGGNTAAARVFQSAATPGSIVVQRDPLPGAQPPASAMQQEIIPPEWVRRPSPQDLLVAVAGDRMVVLPAAGNLLPLERPAEAAAPAAGPVLALPTVAKESVKLVKVGDTTGFLIDAGGSPAVVVPAGMAAMSSALGVTEVRGVLITHLHDDHVRSSWHRPFGATPRPWIVRPGRASGSQPGRGGSHPAMRGHGGFPVGAQGRVRRLPPVVLRSQVSELPAHPGRESSAPRPLRPVTGPRCASFGRSVPSRFALRGLRMC
jgi:hypothetical protein